MKNKLLRLTLSLALTVVLVGALPAAAAGLPPQDPPAASTRAEQFQTYVRTYNGVKQYRIWSLTRGVWVNDWTNC